MSKRTRNRELARLAKRRQEEKRERQRKRQATIAVALVVAVVGGAVAFFAFTGDEPVPQATGPTGPTGSPSPSPSLEGEPGTQIGTVDPEPGPRIVACDAEAPKGALKPKPQFNAPANVLKNGRAYTATFETSCGDIVIELLDDQAPKTVNSFVFLAQEGFFDGQRIHRIDESIDVLQGGDPTGTGGGGPGYTIPDELTGKESYAAGTFAMANAGPDTGGSQFFIITGVDGHALDDQAAWTIFGEVIESLDVAEQIQGIPISNPEAAAAGDLTGQQPSQAVYIEKVTIATK